ncbi:hypothetical protein GJ496_004378 [Pomphorhynchus laevis]|nr:hypothetical protein GJ496_004378 [Pomphorhynchus laevis]
MWADNCSNLFINRSCIMRMVVAVRQYTMDELKKNGLRSEWSYVRDVQRRNKITIFSMIVIEILMFTLIIVSVSVKHKRKFDRLIKRRNDIIRHSYRESRERKAIIQRRQTIQWSDQTR